MGKIVTFGEIMLRLAPEGYNRFVQSSVLGATYGGGEANVAISLANFGLNAVYVTKLPSHEIGQAAVNKLRSFGVDTSKIVRGGKRIGIYFLEKQGIPFNQDSIKKDDSGNITLIYLKEEIAGFAVHLRQGL